MAFVPLAGAIVLLVFCQDSQPGPNRFGPSPKDAPPEPVSVQS